LRLGVLLGGIGVVQGVTQLLPNLFSVEYFVIFEEVLAIICCEMLLLFMLLLLSWCLVGSSFWLDDGLVHLYLVLIELYVLRLLLLVIGLVSKDVLVSGAGYQEGIVLVPAHAFIFALCLLLQIIHKSLVIKIYNISRFYSNTQRGIECSACFEVRQAVFGGVVKGIVFSGLIIAVLIVHLGSDNG
jgi:hypothetical protein